MREVGTGLCCLEGSTAEQSGGGPFIDVHGKVVAISFGTYYDYDPTGMLIYCI
jgi:hypothetical protein